MCSHDIIFRINITHQMWSHDSFKAQYYGFVKSRFWKSKSAYLTYTQLLRNSRLLSRIYSSLLWSKCKYNIINTEDWFSNVRYQIKRFHKTKECFVWIIRKRFAPFGLPLLSDEMKMLQWIFLVLYLHLDGIQGVYLQMLLAVFPF